MMVSRMRKTKGRKFMKTMRRAAVAPPAVRRVQGLVLDRAPFPDFQLLGTDLKRESSCHERFVVSIET